MKKFFSLPYWTIILFSAYFTGTTGIFSKATSLLLELNDSLANDLFPV